MKALNEQELGILYNNFIMYRDKACHGWAKMSVQDFYEKFGLNGYAKLEKKRQLKRANNG